MIVLASPDRGHFDRALELAAAAEAAGNLPIGAVVASGAEILAEGANAVLVPRFHPGRHAEMEALARVPVEWWPRARELTCFTTLEPCLMCLGALLLHGLGRVVFGAHDPLGGAGRVLRDLPPFLAEPARRVQWIGPVAPELCDGLFRRAAQRLGLEPPAP